jgi:hypothetical protein
LRVLCPGGAIAPVRCRNRGLPPTFDERQFPLLPEARTGHEEVHRRADDPGRREFTPQELEEATATSNAATAKLWPRLQWVESFVTPNKTFCVYLAESEGVIQEHSQLSGFPANRVNEVGGIIDPTTAS